MELFALEDQKKNNKVEEGSIAELPKLWQNDENPSVFDDESFLTLAKSANVSKIDS